MNQRSVKHGKSRGFRAAAKEASADWGAHLPALLQQSVAGIAGVGAGGRLMWVNPRLCDLLGYPEAELVGNPIQAFINLGELDVIQAPLNLEAQCRRKDGSPLWIHVTLSTFDAPSDTPSGAQDGTAHEQPPAALAMIIDITARKQAEAKLREREADLARMQQLVGVGGVDINLAAGMTGQRSPEYMQLHGLSADAAFETHEDWLRRVHPQDRERANHTLHQALAGPGTRYENEYRIIRPNDGATRWIQVRADIERDAQGRPVRMLGVHSDVTAQHELESALRENEARQTTILETMAEGVIVLDRDDYFVGANAAAERILGVTRNDLIGRSAGDPPFRRLTLDGQPMQVRSMLAEVEASGNQVFHNDYIIERQDGSQVVISRNLTALRNAEGVCTGFVSTITDITERVRAETVVRLAAELDEFRLTLADALNPLDEAGDIIEVAIELLGRHLRTSGVGFAERDEIGTYRNAVADWAMDGLPGLTDPQRVEILQALSLELGAGNTVLIKDATNFPQPGLDGLAPMGLDHPNHAFDSISHIAATCQAANLRAIIATPLFRGDQLVAFLWVGQQDARRWTASEATLVGEVATRIWEAIQRARADQAVRESELRFRTVAELVPDLLWCQDATGQSTWYNRRWLEFTGQTLAEAVGYGWLVVVHPDDRETTRQRFQAAIEAGVPWELEFRIRQVAHEADETDGYCWFLVRAEPVRDATGKIVQWFGAAANIHAQRTALSLLEHRVAERTAELSESQQQLRRLAVRMEHLREEERIRLSREIHDELGSSLTALKMQLSRVIRLYANEIKSERKTNAHGVLSGALNDVYAQMDGLVRVVQDLASDLRPPVLDFIGLVPALEWQARAWAERTGIPCWLDDVSGIHTDLVEPGRTAVFRAFQEALTNVARHAQAAQVRVGIKIEAGQFVLIVSDDGLGIDEATRRNGRSLGLLGMQERIREVAGEVQIESEAGHGTTITIRVPLVPHDPAVPSVASLDGT